jgi:tRNA1(Val) A37 N6-methylase TrmN6
MSPGEKKISFLNRYFIYKKIRNVDTETIFNSLLDTSKQYETNIEKENKDIEKNIEKMKTCKVIRKLKHKLKLVMIDEMEDRNQVDIIDQGQEETKQNEIIIDEDGFVDDVDDVAEQEYEQPDINSMSSKFDETVLNYDIRDVKHKLDYKLFTISQSSNYSSLMPWHLKQVEEFYKGLFKRKILKIIDATANIGVDTIFFSKLFPSSLITSYEIMEDEFNHLKQNIKAFNLENRITAIHDAFGRNLELLPEEDAKTKSFVYIDAPWGGPDYYKKTNLALFLDEKNSPEMNILEISKYLLTNHKTSYVILKVPRNYEFNNISNIFEIVKRGDIMRNNSISFVLIVLKLNKSSKRKTYKLKTP